MRLFSILAVLFGLARASAAADASAEIQACLRNAGSGYAISDKLDPPHFTADFDGDGQPDRAVLVERAHQQGILVCWGGRTAPEVLGAGIRFNEMKNLDFSAWRMHSKSRPVARGAGQRRPPRLLGDAFELEWESASAVVYWNGKKFVWYQQGD